MRPQYKAGHMGAPDQSVKRPETLLPRRRRPHTVFRELRAILLHASGGTTLFGDPIQLMRKISH